MIATLFPLAGSPLMSSGIFLARLARTADAVPDALMLAAGWTLARSTHVDYAHPAAIATTRSIVDQTILDAWPETVRLTFDEPQAVLAIWRHPNPPPANPTAAPFPTLADAEHALRVLQAVGAARADAKNDQIACAAANATSLADVAALEREIQSDQVHFEAVADALRAFASPS
jgi:hypothetical protein